MPRRRLDDDRSDPRQNVPYRTANILRVECIEDVLNKIPQSPCPTFVSMGATESLLTHAEGLITIERANDNMPNHPRSGSMVPVLGNLAGGSAWAVVAGGSAVARGMKSKAPTSAGVAGAGAWPATVLLSDDTVSGLSVTTLAETFIPLLKSNDVFSSPLMVNF